MKNDIKTAALRRGVISGFDAAMKNQDCKPSLKERLFRITSSEFQINHNAGLLLGRTLAENIQLAKRRNELHQFILKETYGKKQRRNHPNKSR